MPYTLVPSVPWFVSSADKYNNEMIYAYIKKQLMLRFFMYFYKTGFFLPIKY